ncbi:MAG: adenylosuccinate synthase [Aminivibrio sp.]|jgi:adenylosuccinate synthase|nr:adenylosuccinate synthase [Synergistaceae bacterium]
MKGAVEAVVGAQWGDEGKGRVVDALGPGADVFARYQSGADEGHTVVVGGKKYVFQVLPSGMLYPGKVCVIGNGAVIDPGALLGELGGLQDQGMDRARLIVSYGAHVILPYHRSLDLARERLRGKRWRGSGGAGPAYIDKFNRCGIRVEDLLDTDDLREKLELNLEEKNLILTRIYDSEPLSFDETFELAAEWGKALAPYAGDGGLALDEAVRDGQRVIIEGVHGTMLDLDHGAYPFVELSSPTAAGGCAGLGIGPGAVSRVIGVAKAYCTRAGEGPFPTEDGGELGAFLRERGRESGASPERPRRCGPLDLVALKFAARINGMTAMALTKLDVLSGLEKIPVCTSYETAVGAEARFPCPGELSAARPVYERLDGWKEDISGCRTFEELPSRAREFVEFVEKFCRIPVEIMGVGPGRDQAIFRGPGG